MKGRFLVFVLLCVCYSLADTFEGSTWNRRHPRSAIELGEINPDCPLDDDPSVPTLLQYPADCSKFYKCSFGRAYIVKCPYGLHFDVSSNQCDSPFYAQCKSGATTSTTRSPGSSTRSTTTTRTPAPPTSTSTTQTGTPTLDPNLPIAMPECSDVNSKSQFGIQGNCKWFYKCFNGLAFKMQCREGREWSWTQSDCVDAAIAGCSTSGSPGDGASTTRRTTIASISTTRLTTPSPTSCEAGAEFLSHPTDCHMYIQCDNGFPLERNCPAPLYFNRKTRRCDWLSNNC